MASAWIVERRTKAGDARFHVKWEGPPVERLDGTVRSQLHLGAFATKREAKDRLGWARDEWAAGRVPDPKRIVAAFATKPTVTRVGRDWLASRIDLADASLSQYRSRVDRIEADDIGSMPTNEVTPADVRAWIADLNDDFKPSTVAVFLHVLRMVLDHGGVQPNPARDRTVKLPRGYTKNQRIRLPTREQLAALRGALATDDQRRLLDFLEDTGARIAEACALDWKDVHADRILIRGTKRSTAVRIILNDTHPIRLLADEHGTGRVFAVTGGGMRNAMTATKIGPFSPHDLRHLHGSRLLHSGVSPAVIAERLGHALPTLLASYAHVLPPD